jgi:hypothetical protein
MDKVGNGWVECVNGDALIDSRHARPSFTLHSWWPTGSTTIVSAGHTIPSNTLSSAVRRDGRLPTLVAEITCFFRYLL